MPKKQQTNQPRRKRDFTHNPLNNIDFSEFTEGYKELQKEYLGVLKRSQKKGDKAYKVTFKDHSDLFYIAFSENRGNACYRASRYFRDIFHPFFTGDNYRKEMLNSKAHRCPQLDKYYVEEKVPIPKLMEVLNAQFPCSVCGKGKFNYSDYINDRCYIIEGEGDLNPFTKGYILCYDCYKKYIK